MGINTGEVLVRLGVARGSGERFLAGDTINTASRIQSVAPEMGVGVGLATYEATKPVVEYEELPPAILKGKAEPVRVFHAKASRAHLGVDLTRTHQGVYVGREIDLALLKGLFDKSLAASTVQLVTVVGEPGIGKSRIVAELLAHAQSRAPGLTWRQGRCLPYGDGVTFWALGEILKAHAGILETDDPAAAGAKIDDVVPAGPDRDWLRQRLRPLVGVDASSPAEREELFTAWRTFLAASPRPTPRSSCSRTSTGRTTRCSHSSSTSPTARMASRCSSSPPPARSCSSGTARSARICTTRTGSTSPP